MTRSVVLLRAVNLVTRNRLSMKDFRDVLERTGCTGVQTYLQSGNAAVTSAKKPAALEQAVAEALRTDLDLPVAVMVRTGAELDRVVAGNPFAAEGLPPTALHAVFLSAPAPELPDVAPDRIVPGDRVLYVAYAAGSQKSQAAKVLTSRALSPISTARNWRTVLALQELARG